MKKHQHNGFSLIETVVAAAILSFVLVSLGALFVSLGNLSRKSDYIQFAIDLQNELLKSINSVSCSNEAAQAALMSLMRSKERSVTAEIESKNCDLKFQNKDRQIITLQKDQENLFLFKGNTKDALVLKYNVFAKNGSVYFTYEFKAKSLTSNDPKYASTISVNLSKFKSSRYEVNEYLLQRLSNEENSNEVCDGNSFARTRDSTGRLRCIKKDPNFSCPSGSVLTKVNLNINSVDSSMNAKGECVKLNTITCNDSYSPVSFNLQSLAPASIATRSMASVSRCQLVPKTTSIKEFGPYEGIKATGCPNPSQFEIDVTNSRCVAVSNGELYDTQLRGLAHFDPEKNEFECKITPEMKKEEILLKVVLACRAKIDPIKPAEVSP